MSNISQHDQYKIEEDSPLPIKKISTLFIINGITSLLAWNVILSSLDYFHYVYGEYNVYLYLPIPVFLGYFITAAFFNKLFIRLGDKILIVCGLLGINASLALMLGVSLLDIDMDVGFWLVMVLCLWMGIFGNITQLTFYSLMNYFGWKTIVNYQMGMSISGLLITIARIIVVAILGSDDGNKVPIIAYVFVAEMFVFITLYVNLQLFKSTAYREIIEQEREGFGDEIDSLSSCSSGQERTRESYPLMLWNTLKDILPYPIYIFFNLIITFTLFPNLSLNKKMALNETWATLLLLLSYNVGDVLGKGLATFRQIYNSWSVAYLLFARLFFFYSIPLLVKSFTSEDHLFNNDYFPYFNQFLFGVTTGFSINTNFVLLFEKVSMRENRYAGIVGVLILQLGIVFGTFLAIPVTDFVHPDL